MGQSEVNYRHVESNFHQSGSRSRVVYSAEETLKSLQTGMQTFHAPVVPPFSRPSNTLGSGALLGRIGTIDEIEAVAILCDVSRGRVIIWEKEVLGWNV
jgi:hypothetical protein